MGIMKPIVHWLLQPLALLLLAAAADAQSGGVADLPLVELPADSQRPYLAVLLTGDGGWADLDRQVAARLVAPAACRPGA